MSPVRTLIADDEPSIRLLLRTVLAYQHDFDLCGEAPDGIEAVRLAEHLQPDLAILDLEMPGVHGVDAIQQIHQRSPGTRIVVFSALDAELMERECLSRGAAAYVEKGIGIEELMERLRGAISGTARDTARMAGVSTDT